MKVCVLFYHKNIHKFNPKWIQKCINSIQNQTFNNFDILELDYDNTNHQLIKNSIFENIQLNNHVEAMNYLIKKAKNLNYDYIFNTNIDDYYTLDRIEEQLKYLKNYDMVSSELYCFKENNKILLISKTENAKLDIKQNIENNINIIAHPSVAWKSSFFDNLEYQNEIPEEDMRLWQRALKQNKKIFIIPKILLYYRIHDNQITQLMKKGKTETNKQALNDFTKCFEKTTKTFVTWRNIRESFDNWWKKYHPEKQLPNDYDLRNAINNVIGEYISRKGWNVRINI